MNRLLLSLVGGLSLLAACESSSDSNPTGAAGAPSEDGGASSKGGDSATAGATPDPSGNAGAPEQTGGMSSGGTSTGAAGNENVAGGDNDMTPTCEIPETVLGSCVKKDLMGNIEACSVYWGSAFTADALKTACAAELTLGKNVCPSAGSVGVCETPNGPTALAGYYYNAADATPANQAQCNMNTGHVWCSP